MNMTTSETSTYSGSLKAGWNTEGTYDRVQFSGNITTPTEIADLIAQGKTMLSDTNRSRLDLRLRINLNRAEVAEIQAKHPEVELSAIFEPSDLNTTREITICYNNSERRVSAEGLSILSQRVRSDLNRVQVEFEQSAELELKKLLQKGLTPVKSGFNAEEIHDLWSDSFGWELDQCRELVENLNGPSRIYGLRDANASLIAAILTFDDGTSVESTEWAVNPNLQGHGLIKGLLIYANAQTKIQNPQTPIYAQARVGRSIAPALYAGMTVFAPNLDLGHGILTNHVTVSTNEKPDVHNQYIRPFGGMQTDALRSFSNAQVIPERYTDEILDKYNQF
jgi:hypothetical protein